MKLLEILAALLMIAGSAVAQVPLYSDDFGLNISSTNLAGYTHISKFGRSTNVDAVATDVWDMANTTEDIDLWTAPTASRVHDLVTNSSNDYAVGTGCRTIEVQGLDGDWTIQAEIVTLSSGAIPSQTTNSYRRIYRAICKTFGSGALNDGDIFLRALTDKTTTAMVTAGFGQTLMAIWTCPAASTCFIQSYYANFNKSGGSTGSIDVTLFVRSGADQADSGWTVKHHAGLISAGSSHFLHPFAPSVRIPAMSDVRIQAFGSTTDLDVSAGFDIIIIEN